MKHNWYPYPYDTPGENLMGERRRICKNCNTVQIQVTEYWYGRIASRKWMPLAGRCKPRKKSDM